MAKPNKTGRLHDLKTLPPHFEKVLQGFKPFEVRFNDRDYAVGDTLLLREWSPDSDGVYSGREVKGVVTYIHEGLGMASGCVVLSLAIRPHVSKMSDALWDALEAVGANRSNDATLPEHVTWRRIDALTKRGLVLRPHQGRPFFVALTPAGAEALRLRKETA